MEAEFPACLRHVFVTEGGFTNDPSSHGGTTNWDIKVITLAHWRGHPVTAAEVRAIQPEERRAIYHANYWNAARCKDLPGGVDLVVFDVSMNSGPRWAVRMLQQAVGANLVDGIFGSATMKAFAAMAPADIVPRLDVSRRAFYRVLVERDPSQGRFITGWLNRVAATTEVAQKMTR